MHINRLVSKDGCLSLLNYFSKSTTTVHCPSVVRGEFSPGGNDEHRHLAIKLYNGVIPKIGLEIHAQLAVRSKLFSQGSTFKEGAPNTQLDLFDISLPGTLPKFNRAALEAAMLSSLGLNCTIQDVIHFDRKNYFYADMPAGFQITQFNKPLAKDGYIDFVVSAYRGSRAMYLVQYDLVKHLYSSKSSALDKFVPYIKRSRVRQVQLEQDSAKSLHQISNDSHNEAFNLVDYNRSGASLIEIVFDPDLTNHHEAFSLVSDLISTLKATGTCECVMQEGSLRVDANVSIASIAGDAISNSARVELKNVNSLRSLINGIQHEILRQSELIRNGQPVIQETRTFDNSSNTTVPLRIKEESLDYRFVPEPNIPPLRIDRKMVDEVKRNLPEDLPYNIVQNLVQKYSLDLILAKEFIKLPGLEKYFAEVMDCESSYDANAIADFLLHSLHNLQNLAGSPLKVDLRDENGDFLQRLEPRKLQALFDMVTRDEISFATAYEVMKYLFTTKDKSDPSKLVSDFGWYQINEDSQIEELCTDLITKMKNISKRYRKKGRKSDLRMMVQKLCELTDNKISVKKAIVKLDELLSPPKCEEA